MVGVQKLDERRIFNAIQPISSHPAWIEIDVSQFKRNLAAIKRRIGMRKFCFPVKGNGYGHGLCEIGQAAQEEGVDCLGVAFLKEAIELRRSGIRIPMLVFGAIHENQIEDLIDFELEFSISSRYKAELVANRCEALGKRCRVHIEVDTGMRRTGLRPESVGELLRFLKNKECFDVVGIYSHLATSEAPNDSFALKQIALFKHLAEQMGEAGKSMVWHLANSGGVLYYPDSYFDMVRPGLVCYGYYPEGISDPEGEIKPCLSLKARVSYFKVVGANEGISYNHLYKTAKQTRVVTVPVGYADGYRRSLTNCGPVLIRGRRFQVSGAVCMDQFMVDIGSAEVYVGDEVTLIGKQGNQEITLREISQLTHSIFNEVLCGFNDRLPRIYIRNCQ